MIAHAHGHHHDSLADLLEMDAQVLHDYWTDAMAWVNAATGGRPARRVLDVGAGTGVGTIALAERFSDAEVVAVDASEEMLERIRSRIRSRVADGALAERVTTVALDLDGSWPELGAFDVIWASAVLHELDDPDAVIGRMHRVLSPGGLFAVVEIDGPPKFLEDSVGDGLEVRIHDVLGRARAGDNDYPDWTAGLKRAGFVDVEKASFSVDLALEPGGLGGRYAQTYLRRIQPVVADGLSESDRVMLDALVADDGASSVRHRGDLRLRTGRTGWIARQP